MGGFDIRCKQLEQSDECPAEHAEHICCEGGNPNLRYFMGAARTYIYYSKWFESNWLYPSPTPNDIKNNDNTEANTSDGSKRILDEACWSTRAIANIGGIFATSAALTEFAGASILQTLGNDYRMQDVLQHYYLYDLMSEQIDEISDEVVKWVDDDIITWIAARFLLVFWLTGCGQPCYTCAYEGTVCEDGAEGPPGNAQTQAFVRGLTNHWVSVYNSTGFFAHESFPQDYFGRLYQIPQPIIGWQLYFIDQCNYCGCILFCILRRCRDPWATRTGFYSRVFLFNRYTGIPYRYPAPLINFALSAKEDAGFGKSPIMLDHLADEYVWAYGYSNLYRGNINYTPEGGSEPKDLKTITLGDMIKDRDTGGENNDIVGDYINEKGVKEATFTRAGYDPEKDLYRFSFLEGSTETYITTPPIPPPSDANEPPLDFFPQHVRELAVKYKTAQYASDQDALFTAGWLVVDVPEIIEPRITSVAFAADEDKLPMLWYETTTALWGPYRNSTQFYGRTVLNRGFMTQIDDIMDMKAGGENEPQGDCLYHPQIYAKQFVQKTVKAPYNLYFKDGEAEFRQCKLFETIYDLEPGRYYFPNPYICRNWLLNWYDFNIMGGKEGVHYEVDDSEGEVYRYFSTSLPMQFLGSDGTIPLTDMQARLCEAIRVLGFPWQQDPTDDGPVNLYPMEDMMYRMNLASFQERLYDTITQNSCNTDNLKQGINDFFRDLYLAGYREFSPGGGGSINIDGTLQ